MNNIQFAKLVSVDAAGGSQFEQVDKSIYCSVKVNPDPVVQRKKKRKEKYNHSVMKSL